jgi:hypothetical protein
MTDENVDDEHAVVELEVGVDRIAEQNGRAAAICRMNAREVGGALRTRSLRNG